MELARIYTRIAQIFPLNVINRIDMFLTAEGSVLVVIDVHGMRCMEAKAVIKNLVAVVHSTSENIQIKVIHGYHNGTAIKDMLLTNFESSYADSITSDLWNPGLTYIAVA